MLVYQRVTPCPRPAKARQGESMTNVQQTIPGHVKKMTEAGEGQNDTHLIR
jgi:hypothetical protein